MAEKKRTGGRWIKKLVPVGLIAGLLLTMVGVCRGANSYLQFNGSTGYVTVPNNAALNFGTNDFSFSFWMKLNNIENLQCIFERYKNISSDMYIGVSNEIFSVMLVGEESEGYWYYPFQLTKEMVGKWVHVIIIKTNAGIEVYFNNILSTVLEGFAKGGNPIMNFPTGTATQIGALANLSRFYSGDIDDLRIYAKALTQDEITAINNNGRGTKYTGAAAEGGEAVYVLNFDDYDPQNPTKTYDEINASEATLHGGVEWKAGGTPFVTVMRGRYESGNQTGVRGRERY